MIQTSGPGRYLPKTERHVPDDQIDRMIESHLVLWPDATVEAVMRSTGLKKQQVLGGMARRNTLSAPTVPPRESATYATLVRLGIYPGDLWAFYGTDPKRPTLGYTATEEGLIVKHSTNKDNPRTFDMINQITGSTVTTLGFNAKVWAVKL